MSKRAEPPKTISAMTTKWAPMLRDLDTDREKQFLALVLEREARYLNDSGGVQGLSTAELKYTFPLLRRASAHFQPGVMPEFEDVIQVFRDETINIIDVVLARSLERSGDLSEIPSPSDFDRIIPGMAERVQQAIKDFDEVPR